MKRATGVAMRAAVKEFNLAEDRAVWTRRESHDSVHAVPRHLAVAYHDRDGARSRIEPGKMDAEPRRRIACEDALLEDDVPKEVVRIVRFDVDAAVRGSTIGIDKTTVAHRETVRSDDAHRIAERALARDVLDKRVDWTIHVYAVTASIGDCESFYGDVTAISERKRVAVRRKRIAAAVGVVLLVHRDARPLATAYSDVLRSLFHAEQRVVTVDKRALLCSDDDARLEDKLEVRAVELKWADVPSAALGVYDKRRLVRVKRLLEARSRVLGIVPEGRDAHRLGVKCRHTGNSEDKGCKTTFHLYSPRGVT